MDASTKGDLSSRLDTVIEEPDAGLGNGGLDRGDYDMHLADLASYVSSR